MNTAPLKNFATQSRNILKQGVLNRILALGFDLQGNVTVPEPTKIQGGTLFQGQLLDEDFHDAWKQLKFRIAAHGIKETCEEAAYIWFNRLVAIRIMQKNHYIEPVMEYANGESRMPVIVAQARAGRLTLTLKATDREKLRNLLSDPTQTEAQFALLLEAFCESNPVIYSCFGGIDKYVSLLLPDNILAKGGFIDLLNNTTYLSDEDYAQSELIGWLYQFYISEKKDEVFDSFKKGKKAEAEDIPAATQIFTPNWIVKYMVQNTLGRTYLDNNPDSPLADQMKYLVRTDEPTPEEAILKIDDITEYKMIDPACGSGHILNEGFDLLYAMYMDEFYSPRVAIENIFKKNLIGIDIDTRAKQLATFALLMKAASKDSSFLDAKVMPRVLDMPEPFVYPGLPEEFFPHYGISGEKAVRECTEAFELLKQACNLGSIMKFGISDETRYIIEDRTAYWEAQEFVPEAIRAAVPSMKVILALTDSYTAVVANPPYMGYGNMNQELTNYVTINYCLGRQDLFSVFMLFAIDILTNNGRLGMINMHSWMFLTSFEELRKHIIDNLQIETMLHLGARTFTELSGEVVQNTAFTISKCKPTAHGTYFRLLEGPCADKERDFLDRKSCYSNITQITFSEIPSYPIAYWLNEHFISLFSNPKLGDIADPRKGLCTLDDSRFLRFWHEVNANQFEIPGLEKKDVLDRNKKWIACNKGGGSVKWYGLNNIVINWKDNGKELKEFIVYKYNGGSYTKEIRSESYYFHEGFTWSGMTSGNPTFRYFEKGCVFSSAGSSAFPSSNIHYYLGLLNSSVSHAFFEILSPTLSVLAGHIAKIPVIFNLSNEIEEFVGDNIILTKQDLNTHETSWGFKKNELLRMQQNCNQTCADLDLLSQEEAKEIKSERNGPINANLISDCLKAYKNEWSRKFCQLHQNEEELNRKFIEIYGLQDELTPDVPLNEITILQQGEISIENNAIVWHDNVIIKQFISYAIGCWMGRYRLDKEGWNIAYYPNDDEICAYDVNGCRFQIDDDGIIPLMSHLNPFEDDNALQKIVNFVKIVFGADNLTKNLNFIEHCLGKSIEDYLIKDFWKDHKRMYQNRPIYWLFSSRKGAFQAIVYMHRMNPYTAEKLRTKYLLPYIDYLQTRIQQDKARGADLSTLERKNLSKMEAALAECHEYHDRLHETAIRQIDFDLDDGVAVNYAKFGDVLAKIK